MQYQRRFERRFYFIICLLLSCFLLLMAGCGGPDRSINAQNAWDIKSEKTKAALHRMDAMVNSGSGENRDENFENYMSMFSPDVIIHGLVPGTVDYQGVREFYGALFGTFEDSVLVSDELIIAGDMAAQRYHSLGYMTGEFDGVKMDRKRVAIRGQTFFKIDDNEQIIERWSNHDHGFRLAQILGDERRQDGDWMAKALNGPGLSEAEIYQRLDEMRNIFSRIDNPKIRRQEFFALFDKDLIVHGLRGEENANYQDFENYIDEFWTVYPDAILSIDSMLSAWSMGAIRWQVTGSDRSATSKSSADWMPTKLTGDAILTYRATGKIDRVWLRVNTLNRLE